MFKKHPYGTQTTIGTIDHLKNPSLKRIREYYNKYYVPNNMAICISGDFDPEWTIKMINDYFGKLPGREVSPFVPPVENAITSPVVKEVYGPDAEMMLMGYRFAGAGSEDAKMIQLIDKILYNGVSGLVDLNLVKAQKVLDAYTGTDIKQDYSVHVLGGQPKEGQSLQQLKDLLVAQIEKIKKGDFPDWLLSAIINNMKLDRTKELESNSSRTFSMVDAFILNKRWSDKVNEIDELAKITKNQVMEFAKKYYTNNYVVVYKHTGEDKNVQKVTKPLITPVEVNRNAQSPFVKAIADAPVTDIKPVFVDYSVDIQQSKVKNVPIYATINHENATFNLYYILDMGTNTDKKLGVAIQYLKYLGTPEYTPDKLQQEFYKLACSFDVSVSQDQVYVSLSGLSENFEAAAGLLEKLLANPQPNPKALEGLISDIKKSRADAKLSKDQILWDAMLAYATYGAKSPQTNILSDAELKALKPQELVDLVKGLMSYEHHILYYGPRSVNTVAIQLSTLHRCPDQLKPVPPPQQFEEQPNDANKVYVIDYDMKQAEILMLSRGGLYDNTLVPQVRMYNEYFGGGMSSIVFQDLRESRALAYSTFSNYSTPGMKERHFLNYAYIGTQSDKMPEAMKGMTELLNSMPGADLTFASAKNSVLQGLRTSRVTRTSILWNYENARKLGLDHDSRKDIYDKVMDMTLNDVKAFQQKYVKGHKYNIMILGDKKTMDMKMLEQYGAVKELTLQEIFGY
jgi:predicted Zn-dependent peptidase